MLGFELLAGTGLAEGEFRDCVATARASGQPLERVLVATGLVSEQELLGRLAEFLELPFRGELKDAQVPADFLKSVPLRFARFHQVVAVGEQDGTVLVATATPTEPGPAYAVSQLLARPVSLVVAPREEIASLVDRAYEQNAELVGEVLAVMEEDDAIAKLLSDVSLEGDLLDVANKAPVVRLVNALFFQALRRRASDIHLQPFPEKFQVRFRIDGVLYDSFALPKKVQEAVLSRVKVLGGMDIAEKRLPQDGRHTIHLGKKEIDLRISSLPTPDGERIVIRLLDKSSRLYRLHELGLCQEDCARFERLIHCPHGIILVTGPTGSGKTTTLYAALDRLNSREKNVITVEDPIEYRLPGISQTQVSYKKGLTFATGLRTVLRQDPDIIMVGEIRDLETARMAIQSALTGHLVFSTLHTNDSVSAVTRLLDLGIEPYLVSSSLVAVMAQRLVRLICPNCKEACAPTEEEMLRLGSSPDQVRGVQLYRGRGCRECMHTGYWDRTGIYELLLIDDEVRQAVMSRDSAGAIRQKAVARGLRTLRMDGVRKALDGKTTLAEVLKVTQMELD